MTSQSFRAAALALFVPGATAALAQTNEEDAPPQPDLKLNAVSDAEAGGVD